MSTDDENKQFDELRRSLLAAYGANVSRWPEGAKEARDPTPATEVALAEAEDIDRLLEAASAPVPSKLQIENMLKDVRKTTGTEAYVLPTRRFFILPLGALALAVMLGIIVGQSLTYGERHRATAFGFHYLDII